MSEHEIITGGIRLAYRVSGEPDAPPMVLLHALGETSASWAEVTPQFAMTYRVFAPDLRGHGDSDWPGDYSFRLMRDDILGLLDRLGLTGVTLAGHSMGATVAYLIAEQHGSPMERLIIEDAPPPYPRDRPVPDRPDGPLPFDWAALQAVMSQAGQHDPDMWDRLSQITAPTLLIGGGPGSHIPQDLLVAVAARIPRCDLVTIAAGHHVHASRPAEFASAVLAWLRGLPDVAG